MPSECIVEKCYNNSLCYLGDGKFDNGIGVADILWCSSCGSLYLENSSNKVYMRKVGDVNFTPIEYAESF